MSALSALALEIDAHDFDPRNDTPTTLCYYIHNLIDALHSTMLKHEPEPENASVLPICALFRTNLEIVCRHGNRDDMIRLAEETGDLILSIDNDDGWPGCPWLYTLKCCAVALQMGLQYPERTRWPAAASHAVLEISASESRPITNKIMREMLGKAVKQTALAEAPV